MRFRHKLVLHSLLVVFLSIALTLYPFALFTYRAVWQGAEERLAGVAQLKAELLLTLADHSVTAVSDIASHPRLAGYLALRPAGAGPGGEAEEDEEEEARAALRSELESHLSHSGFSALSLADADGIIAVSTQEGEEGSTIASDSLFAGALEEPSVAPLHADAGIPVLRVASPVAAGGKTLGVLIATISPERVLGIVTSHAALGETGENFLVDSDARLASALGKEGAPGIGALMQTDAVRSCLSGGGSSGLDGSSAGGHDGFRGTWTDYAGDRVMGMFLRIPEYDACLVVKRDAAETVAPLVVLAKRLALVVLAFSLIVMALSTLFASRQFRPFEALHATMGKASQGDLRARAHVQTGDEFEDFASGFNRMLAELEAGRKEISRRKDILESEVRRRTRDIMASQGKLQEKVAELEQTRSAMLNMLEDLDHSKEDLLKNHRELSSAMEELRQMDLKKNEFVSIASHELKTPVTSIRGFVQLLLASEGSVPEEARGYLGIINEETVRLNGLITDILDLSRLDLHVLAFDYAEVSVPALVKETLNEISPLLKEPALRARLDIRPGVGNARLDPQRVKQVLLNFLTNAIKYSPKGGIILVSVRREGSRLAFSVRDAGPGIAKKDQEKLFTRFYQVDSSLTRKKSGVGLGLAISKELVEVMGGSIGLESAAGKGSTFFFTLPLMPPKAVPQLEAGAGQHRPKGRPSGRAPS